MPITVAIGGNVQGWQTSATLRDELDISLAKLKFADLFRGSGTIVKGTVRVDVQGPWTEGPGKNIQAQTGKRTVVAAMLIADSLGEAQGPVNQSNVVQAAQDALVDSGRDGLWRILTGTSP